MVNANASHFTKWPGKPQLAPVPGPEAASCRRDIGFRMPTESTPLPGTQRTYEYPSGVLTALQGTHRLPLVMINANLQSCSQLVKGEFEHVNSKHEGRTHQDQYRRKRIESMNQYTHKSRRQAGGRAIFMNSGFPATGQLRELYDALKNGEIDRRTFIHRASLIGIGATSLVFLANTASITAQDASPATGDETSRSIRPEVGTENQERGGGGVLKIIQWQAPTLLSPHVATGSKDWLAAVLVVEPLMHYLPDSSMYPNLLIEVPTLENGLLNEDLTEVTLKLLPDVLWSDGEPFTAEDVVFTIDWVKDPANGAVNVSSFESITSASVIDDLTVRVTYAETNPFWFDAFTGTTTGYVYPKHILAAGPEAHDTFLSAPIGTGPYIVESFTPNDQATYVLNERYREPNKPFFDRVELKGGGDAASAARAVLQTGEYDFATTLKIEPQLFEELLSGDTRGVLIPGLGNSVEVLSFNFSDPSIEVDGQRSEMNTPHPFLSDDAVREAIAVAIDRQKIVDEFYGGGQEAATNIVNGDPEVESPNTVREYNPEKAVQILEDAGWVMDGDVRARDGVQLKLNLATTVNSVRQKTQAVIKANLESIGIKVDLEQVDAGIFFDGSVGNEQNINHFYWDTNMFSQVPSSPRPLAFMEAWYAGPDKSNIAQKSNGWKPKNQARWANDDFDAAFEAAKTEVDPKVLADLFITMNDLVIQNHVVVPLVLVGTPGAMSNRIREENIAPAPFSGSYWNIANWNLADTTEE